MTPKVKAGEIWRRRKTGLEVRIVSVTQTWCDISWVAVEGKQRGRCYEFNFVQRYDLVEVPA